jgi:hypothetical protein
MQFVTCGINTDTRFEFFAVIGVRFTVLTARTEKAEAKGECQDKCKNFFHKCKNSFQKQG